MSSDVFTDRIIDLRTSAEGYGDATNTGDPHWQSMREDGDPVDLRGTENAKSRFSRDAYAKEYLDATTGEEPTSYKTAAVAKVKSDVLAGMERDLRMRYRGRVRTIGHAFARMKTHGMQDGVINRHIAGYVKIMSERK